MMNIKKTSLLLLPVLMLAACANFTPRMKPDEKLLPTDSFIYGSFFINAGKVALSADGHVSMGLGLSCNDGSQYLVRFYRENPVHIIKVKPATCNINEIVYTDSDGNIKDRKALKGQALHNLILKPGTAYYLGDFSAMARITYGTHSNLTQWELSQPVNRFKQTTEALHELYPNTVGIPNAPL